MPSAWNGALHNPSAVSAASAMTCAIGAAERIVARPGVCRDRSITKRETRLKATAKTEQHAHV